ncbi:hypothetical protein BX070DRAFT_59658 [Coemansia spiralis]|nr:hypothetical protein BX070DRAFT_59658 [Coemansia spiralis]
MSAWDFASIFSCAVLANYCANVRLGRPFVLHHAFAVLLCAFPFLSPPLVVGDFLPNMHTRLSFKAFSVLSRFSPALPNLYFPRKLARQT